MSIEILAPVGNREMLETAINNNADAVYLGGSYFNARMKADNFKDNDLEESVKLCHAYGKKVYLTLNTLIANKEIPLLLKQVNSALKSGVDAFIVQDLGIAYILKNYFKDIVLHASTQLGVHNLDGALVAQKLGFKRVVLSREATLEDIKQIRENTDLEIEYFVHGALCVAFSGNCYLSSFVKNKSGNRGECLQLCRLFYNSFNSKEQKVNDGYLLSTRDLAYYNQVKQLIDAGVTSFKIEGRLKRPSYVALTVKLYKKIAEGYTITENDKINLKKVFSRGDFNNGEYLQDKNSNIINNQVQNHLGVKIGKVVDVTKFKDLHKITLKINHNLATSDGLKFVSKQGYVNSLGVGNVEKKNGFYTIYSKTYPNIEDDVYLTVDNKFEQDLLNVENKINVDFLFEAKTNSNATLTASCKLNDNSVISVVAKSNFVCEQAKTLGVTEQNVTKSLSKVNNTIFKINNMQVNLQNNLFIPLIEINNLRRNALSMLQDKLIEYYSPKYEIKTEQQLQLLSNILEKEVVITEKPQKEVLMITNINNVNEQIINKDVIYSPEIYSNADLDNFINKLKEINFNGTLYYDLPIIENYKDMQIIKEILSNHKDLGIVVNNIYGLNLLKNRKTIFGIYLNISNKFALKNLLSFNLNALYYKSIEKWCDSNMPNALSCNFSVALMTFKHCPFKVNYNTTCKDCSYSKGLVYSSQSGNKFVIKRKKIFDCYFSFMCIDN